MNYHFALIINDIGAGQLVHIILNVHAVVLKTVLIKEDQLLIGELHVVSKHAELVKVPICSESVFLGSSNYRKTKSS